MLERARWVKVNDEELRIVAGIAGVETGDTAETARRVRAAYDTELLIVTLGPRGAVAFDAADQAMEVEPEQEAEVVDTVGAGDAFSSVVILGLLEGWPVPDILRRAQAFAGRVCGQRGATSADLSLYQSALT